MTDWRSSFKIPAWAHQAKEWEHRDAPARMLRWQMRTGKTKAMIDLACYLYKEGRIDGVIVVGPNNVHLNWARREVPKHIWDNVPYRSVAWDSTGSRNVAWEQWFDRFCKDKGTLDWFMVNYEALVNVRAVDHLKRYIKSHPRYLLIVDETHELRGPASKRAKAVHGLRAKAVAARGLSGTITDNSPLHAWSQYEAISGSALGFPKYADFEDFFGIKEMQFIRTKSGTRQVPTITDFKNMDLLTKRIARFTSVVLRDECEDIPELVPEAFLFQLTVEQKRVYNQIVLKNLARMDSGEIIPVKEGGAMKSQLQQIASGWFIGEEGEVVELVTDHQNPRLLALRAHLALCGPKTIIWCRYREDIVRVMRACKLAGFHPVDYYGGTKKVDRAKHEDGFRDDPAIGPLVGQPLACGQGLDFSVADTVIWYSHLDGDLIHRKQANERATMLGGGKVALIDLVAMGTGDEQLLTDMDGKHIRSEAISGEGLRKYLQLIH